MKRTLALTAALLLILVACDAEVQLEPAPAGILDAGECPGTTFTVGDGTQTFEWGSAGAAANTFSYDVDDGYSVTFCLRFGTTPQSLGPVTGRGSQSSSGLNRWSVFTVVPPTSTTEAGGPSTTEAGGPSTTEAGGPSTTEAGGPSTTEAGGPSTTEAGGPSTTEAGGPSTTEAGGPSTTEAGGPSTTEAGGPSTTIGAEDTTTTGEGPPVTEGGGAEDPTTTVEVGAGGLTTTPDSQGEGAGQGEGGEGESEGTLDPSQETSTTEDEVAGASDETLPRTGTGHMSLGGLAALSLAVGAILLLLVRRRFRED